MRTPHYSDPIVSRDTQPNPDEVRDLLRRPCLTVTEFGAAPYHRTLFQVVREHFSDYNDSAIDIFDYIDTWVGDGTVRLGDDVDPATNSIENITGVVDITLRGIDLDEAPPTLDHDIRALRAQASLLHTVVVGHLGLTDADDRPDPAIDAFTTLIADTRYAPESTTWFSFPVTVTQSTLMDAVGDDGNVNNEQRVIQLLTETALEPLLGDTDIWCRDNDGDLNMNILIEDYSWSVVDVLDNAPVGCTDDLIVLLTLNADSLYRIITGIHPDDRKE